jgi:hypothetical protein
MAKNPLTVEDETFIHVRDFHLEHLHPDGEGYDPVSFKEAFCRLNRDSQQFRILPGGKNVKKTRKQIEARKAHSSELQPFSCAEHYAIKNRLFSPQLSEKYDVYKSAFHHFNHDGGLTALKDGYLSSGQKPTETTDMFGLTMINAFTESEFDMWIDGLLLGFEKFYSGFFKMKMIMFNWVYHQLPHINGLMVDLTDKYVHKVMNSPDDVFKQVLVGQIGEDINGTGKIVYHTNWRFLRMFIPAIDDMIETAEIC